MSMYELFSGFGYADTLMFCKCHLHKCQTSLGQVHKLVTHPSNICDRSHISYFGVPHSFGGLATRLDIKLAHAFL